MKNKLKRTLTTLSWALAALVATADTFTWTGGAVDEGGYTGASGFFSNAANWGASTFPGAATNDVVFNLPDAFTVRLGMTVTNNALSITAGKVALDIGTNEVYQLRANATLAATTPCSLSVASGIFTLTNGLLYVGNSTTARSNTVVVAPGASLAVKALSFGKWSASPPLAFNGLAATNATLVLKQSAVGDNSILIEGAGVKLELSGGSVSGYGRMTFNGKSNALILRGGAQYDNVGLVYFNGIQNAIEITGSNTLFVTRNDHFGLSNGGTSNTVLVADGGKWEARSLNASFTIGRGTKYNTFVVGNGGCLDVSSQAISIGAGAENTLRVERGGVVKAAAGISCSGLFHICGGFVDNGSILSMNPTANPGASVVVEDNAVVTNGYFRADSTLAPMTLEFRVKDEGFVPMKVRVSNGWRNTAQFKLVVDASEFAAAGGVGRTVTLVDRNGVETGGNYLAEIPSENITVFPKGSKIIQTPTAIQIRILHACTVLTIR